MARRRTGTALFTLLIAALGFSSDALALRIYDKKSPKNRERPRRARTDFIVLHTTEGAPKGALAKLRRNGEAHYLVNRDGTVYRIVDKDRVAFHAGRSMWDGVANLDRRSIGIEVVGYHHKPIKKKQLRALKELVRQLRGIYGVPAERVLTHAQVAYGRPNRYHRYDHRGRKRCAMNLGTPKMRAALGLGDGPARDPDVDAGRLRVADKKLFGRLFPQVALTSRGRPKRGWRHRAVAKAEPKAEPKPKIAKAEPKPKIARAEPKPEAKVKLAGTAPAAAAHLPGADALDQAVAKLTALLDQAKPEDPAPRPKPALERPAESDSAPPAELADRGATPGGSRGAEPNRSAAPATTSRARAPRRARAPKKAPARTRAVAHQDGLCQVSAARAPAREVAGERYASATTIYILPDGRVRTGADLSKRQAHLLEALPEGTRVLEGKTFGGYVKPSRAPSEICGQRWRSNETVYRFPDGKLLAGPQIDPARLPKATLVFCAS